MAKKGKTKNKLVGEKDIMVSGKKFEEDIIVIEDSQDSVIDVDLLYAHQETFIGELRCAKCGERFESTDDMSTHSSAGKCSAIESICHVCMKVVKGHDKFLDHVKSHGGDEGGGVGQAEETTLYASGIHIDGVSTHDGQEELKCPFCGEDIGHDGIDFEKHLEKHAFADHTGNRYPCIVCDKSFKTRSDLRRHMVRHTNIKPFKCTYCVKTFVTKNELQTHHRSHTGEHPYECDLCNATFTTSSSMKKHRNKHTGETRYICYICSKKYFDSYALNRHIMMHTGERPYHCHICNRGFCQRGDMTVHMRTHTNERPFQCPICFLTFKQSSNRNAHVRRHTMENK